MPNKTQKKIFSGTRQKCPVFTADFLEYHARSPHGCWVRFVVFGILNMLQSPVVAVF